jgi:hypothetical protein
MLTTVAVYVESTVLTSVNFPTLTTMRSLFPLKITSIGLPFTKLQRIPRPWGAHYQALNKCCFKQDVKCHPATGKYIYLKDNPSCAAYRSRNR